MLLCLTIAQNRTHCAAFCQLPDRLTVPNSTVASKRTKGIASMAELTEHEQQGDLVYQGSHSAVRPIQI